MDTLYDEIVLHNIKVESYKTERVMQCVKKLNYLNNVIKTELLRSTSIYTKKRYNEMMKLVKECSKELENTLYDDDEIRQFIENEIYYYEILFDKYTNNKKHDFVIESIIAYLSFYPITGEATIKTYADNIVDRFVNTWDMALRTTYLTKDINKNTIKTVLGGNRNGINTVGTMNIIRNSVEKFTTTEIQSLSQNIITQVSKTYGSAFIGWKWVSILDNRTCVTCGTLHNKEFNNIEDIPSCPLHIHCRCILVPILSNGKTPNYKDYSQWFEEQNEKDKEEILGKTRYKMYKDGMKVNSFVSNNKLLTLNQLSDKQK